MYFKFGVIIGAGTGDGGDRESDLQQLPQVIYNRELVQPYFFSSCVIKKIHFPSHL